MHGILQHAQRRKTFPCNLLRDPFSSYIVVSSQRILNYPWSLSLTLPFVPLVSIWIAYNHESNMSNYSTSFVWNTQNISRVTINFMLVSNKKKKKHKKQRDKRRIERKKVCLLSSMMVRKVKTSISQTRKTKMSVHIWSLHMISRSVEASLNYSNSNQHHDSFV